MEDININKKGNLVIHAERIKIWNYFILIGWMIPNAPETNIEKLLTNHPLRSDGLGKTFHFSFRSRYY